MKDRFGNTLKIGDKVHNKWGYDLIVMYDKTRNNWWGKLVCEKGHSCKNIPYALISDEITKL